MEPRSNFSWQYRPGLISVVWQNQLTNITDEKIVFL